mmetsp:Transcript_6710/g.11764  ORF Transcript_6710/g.11764 Transcript_6710/m.11764 type:complete len:192 (+) Transcript_6710:56-631(+)
MCERFIFNYPTTWVLKERIAGMNTDGWTIEDERGQPVATIQAHKQRRDIPMRFLDAKSGQEIFTGQWDTNFSSVWKYYVQENGQTVYTMRNDIPSWPMGWSCYRGMVNHNGEADNPLVFEAPAPGCCGRQSTWVDARGDEVADVEVNSLQSDFQTYTAEVEPGVNSALVWAMVIAKDAFRDKSHSNQQVMY